jgi:2-isopropylmalate synthase
VYPVITTVTLTDYKVRVLGSKVGTESKVRVLVEWTDHRRTWATVGVSNNVIDASWRALVDALRLELIRLQSGDEAGKPTRDYSWAV